MIAETCSTNCQLQKSKENRITEKGAAARQRLRDKALHFLGALENKREMPTRIMAPAVAAPSE